MNPEIAQLEQQIKNFEINDLDELESFRLQFLSKKGSIQRLIQVNGHHTKSRKSNFWQILK